MGDRRLNGSAWQGRGETDTGGALATGGGDGNRARRFATREARLRDDRAVETHASPRQGLRGAISWSSGVPRQDGVDTLSQSHAERFRPHDPGANPSSEQSRNA